MTRPTGVFVGTSSSTASTRPVSTPPMRVGIRTLSAFSIALARSRSFPGGVSTIATSSASTRSSALSSIRSVGASTSVTAARYSSSEASNHSAALACGSASISVVGRRAADARADRYTDVVVLPTPPFNAAITMIRSCARRYRRRGSLRPHDDVERIDGAPRNLVDANWFWRQTATVTVVRCRQNQGVRRRALRRGRWTRRARRPRS